MVLSGNGSPGPRGELTRRSTLPIGPPAGQTRGGRGAASIAPRMGWMGVSRFIGAGTHFILYWVARNQRACFPRLLTRAVPCQHRTATVRESPWPCRPPMAMKTRPAQRGDVPLLFPASSTERTWRSEHWPYARPSRDRKGAVFEVFCYVRGHGSVGARCTRPHGKASRNAPTCTRSLASRKGADRCGSRGATRASETSWEATEPIISAGHGMESCSQALRSPGKGFEPTHGPLR